MKNNALPLDKIKRDYTFKYYTYASLKLLLDVILPNEQLVNFEANGLTIFCKQ